MWSEIRSMPVAFNGEVRRGRLDAGLRRRGLLAQ